MRYIPKSGELWGVDHECKFWLKFDDCNYCTRCIIKLYMTAIHQKSTVVIFIVFIYLEWYKTQTLVQWTKLRDHRERSITWFSYFTYQIVQLCTLENPDRRFTFINIVLHLIHSGCYENLNVNIPLHFGWVLGSDFFGKLQRWILQILFFVWYQVRVLTLNRSSSNVRSEWERRALLKLLQNQSMSFVTANCYITYTMFDWTT